MPLRLRSLLRGRTDVKRARERRTRCRALRRQLKKICLRLVERGGEEAGVETREHLPAPHEAVVVDVNRLDRSGDLRADQHGVLSGERAARRYILRDGIPCYRD